MRKHIFSVFLVYLILSLLSSCSDNSNKPDTSSVEKGESNQVNTLLLGEIETLTGNSSDNLKLAADGAKMALEYINSSGGITVKGQKYVLEILLEDNKGTSDGAAAAANKLVYDKKVKFIVGGAQGFINLAISSVTEPAEVLYVAEFNNGARAELSTTTPLKFFANNDSFSSQFTAMTYLKKLHPDAKTIAFIQIDDGNFRDIDPVVRETAGKLGLEILGDIIGYNPGMVDISPIVQKAIALTPDAIMVGNGPTAYLGQILKIARVSGYMKPVFSCSNAPPQDVLTIVGKDAATNFFGHGINIDYNIPDLPDITKEIMQIAEKQTGFLNFEQIHGFNAVYTLVQVIEKAQSLDPVEVAAAWEKLEYIDTSFGKAKMGGLQTYGVRHNVYFTKPIMRLEKGDLLFGDWIDVYLP